MGKSDLAESAVIVPIHAIIHEAAVGGARTQVLYYEVGCLLSGMLCCGADTPSVAQQIYDCM